MTVILNRRYAPAVRGTSWVLGAMLGTGRRCAPTVREDRPNIARRSTPKTPRGRAGAGGRFAWFIALNRVGIVLAVSGPMAGCAGIATNAAANALSGTGTVFASDDDPEFVAAAVPFGLKTMEAVLEETPEHKGLLLALTSGYVQYGYAFVAEDADRIRSDDYERAEYLEERALGLYKRALGYGQRALEVQHKGFLRRLREAPDQLFDELDADRDTPVLYWTAAAWALSIAASDMAPDAIADFPLVEQLARWALALDEDWNHGAIHTLMLSIEAGKPGGNLAAAESHFKRAVELEEGRRAGTFVSMAENVAVPRQDVVLFHELLDQALAVELDEYPEERLANVVMQRRAARLKQREEDYFLETLDEISSSSNDELSSTSPE